MPSAVGFEPMTFSSVLYSAASMLSLVTIGTPAKLRAYYVTTCPVQATNYKHYKNDIDRNLKLG